MAIDPLFGLKVQQAVGASVPDSSDIGTSLVKAVQVGQQVTANQLQRGAQRLEHAVARRLNPLKINAATVALRQAELNVRRTEQVSEAAALELEMATALQPYQIAANRATLLAQGAQAAASLSEITRRKALLTQYVNDLDTMEQVVRSPVFSDEEQQFLQERVQPQLEAIRRTRQELQSASSDISISPQAFADLDRQESDLVRGFELARDSRAMSRVTQFFDFVERSSAVSASDPALSDRLFLLQQELANNPDTRSAFNLELARRNAPVQFAGDPEIRQLAMARLADLGKPATKEEVATAYQAAAQDVEQGRTFRNFSGEEAAVVDSTIRAFTKGSQHEVEQTQAYLRRQAQYGPEQFKSAVRSRIGSQLGAETGRAYAQLASSAQGLYRIETLFGELLEEEPSLRDGSISGKTLNQVMKRLRSQNPNIARIDTAMGETIAGFVRSVSGAAVTDSEFKRLSDLFSQWDEGEAPFRAKLEEMRNAFNRNLRNIATLSGVPVEGVDYALSELFDSGLQTTEASTVVVPQDAKEVGSFQGTPYYLSGDQKEIMWLTPGGNLERAPATPDLLRELGQEPLGRFR